MTGDPWLRLLADDPSPDAIDALRLSLLAAGGAAEDVESDAAHAREILRRTTRRQRQSTELAALNDLARRLAALTPSQGMLQEVTAHARRLLSVDLAYIMVLHDDGRLRIETVDGSMGSVLRGIELDPGTGLGGEVLRTGAPRSTAGYLDDASLTHLPTVDSAAVSERLSSILGVPMIVDDEPVGVLLVADRSPRRFTGREVELLAALASHAAAAVRNAALIADLRLANRTLGAADASRRQEAGLRDRLMETVVRGGGFGELVEVISEVTGLCTTVLDTGGAPLAGADRTVPAPPADVGARSPYRFRQGSRHGVVVPVLVREGRAGSLVATGEREVTEEDLRLLSVGALTVALVAAFERSMQEAQLRTRGEILTSLLSPDSDETNVRRRARGAGMDVDAIAAVAVLDAYDIDSAADQVARLAHETSGWSARLGDQLTLVVPGLDLAGLHKLLASRRLSGPVGVAACGRGVAGIRWAHQEARQTATMLRALGRCEGVAEPAELGAYRALFARAEADEAKVFIAHTVGPVLDHDEARGRGGALARTVAVYLANAQHHARTCADLHIHANTLYQRLRRADELLGADWRGADRSLDIQLALRLHELALRLAR